MAGGMPGRTRTAGGTVGAAGGPSGCAAAWVMLASRPRMAAISCAEASAAAAAAPWPPSRASGGMSGITSPAGAGGRRRAA